MYALKGPEHGDVSLAIKTLEQCNSNFVKCVIPYILSATAVLKGMNSVLYTPGYSTPGYPTPGYLTSGYSTSDGEDGLSYDDKYCIFGYSIIREVFCSAENVLDMILADELLTGDILDILKYGVVLPSILPTILTYAISNVRSCASVQDLLPSVESLAPKLQAVATRVHVPSVLTPVQRLSANELNNDDQSIIYNTMDVNSSLSTLNNAASDRNNEKKKKNIGICSVSKTEKNTGSKEKDNAQVTWWSLLMKLNTVLHAKLLANLIYPPIRDNIHIDSTEDDERTKVPLTDLMNHNIWLLIAPPEGIFSTLSYIKTSGEVNITLVEDCNAQIRSRCALMREQEMSVDPTYKVLCLLIKRSNTKLLVERTEEAMFEAAAYVQGISIIKYAIFMSLFLWSGLYVYMHIEVNSRIHVYVLTRKLIFYLKVFQKFLSIQVKLTSLLYGN
jgi:hypothetical protein